MKHFRLFIVAVLLLCASSVWAYDFEVNGIYYNIIGDNEVEVTFRDYNYNSYSGQVTIPENVAYQEVNYTVTSIGQYAFLQSSELVKVVLPNTVTSIARLAFQDCRALTSINIPDGVSTIPQQAFRNCKALVSIIIPDAVMSIGYSAFIGCSNLSQLVIGNAVESIAPNAFRGCRTLSSVYIPGSVRTIGNGAFYGCSSLPEFVVDASNVCYTSKSGVLYNYAMDTLVQYPCGKEGPYTMPNSVSFIEKGAFQNSKYLTSVHLNDRVKVDGNTFGGCNLSSINVNSSNNKYKIISGVLYNYDVDTLVFCPQNMEGQCVIPNTVSVIGPMSFRVSKVASVVYPNSIKDIGYEAFCLCDSLKEVNLPASVEHIEYSAFIGCASLKAINVDAGNDNYSSVDGVLFSFSQDTIIQYPAGKSGKIYSIPSTVRAVRDGYNRELSQAYGGYSALGVFSKSKLQSISVPNSVNYVGSYAFCNCQKLTMITLGNAVDSIGIYAISQDSVLQSVVCLGGNPPKYDAVNAMIWSSNDSERILTVPCGRKEIYAEKWGRYFADDQIEEACAGHYVHTFSNDLELGTVSTSTAFAMLGDVVDISIHSTSGYEPSSVEVCHAYDETILVPMSDNRFIMPNFDVTVKVLYSHTSVEENEDAAVSVSPNPASDRVRIVCEGMKHVTLLTPEGKVAKTLNDLNEDESEMELTGLAKGIYLIRIETQDGRNFNRKLIIR